MSQAPERTEQSYLAVPRTKLRSRASACSATSSTQCNGTFVTGIPSSDAVSTATLSTPMPCRGSARGRVGSRRQQQIRAARSPRRHEILSSYELCLTALHQAEAALPSRGRLYGRGDMRRVHLVVPCGQVHRSGRTASACSAIYLCGTAIGGAIGGISKS